MRRPSSDSKARSSTRTGEFGHAQQAVGHDGNEGGIAQALEGPVVGGRGGVGETPLDLSAPALASCPPDAGQRFAGPTGAGTPRSLARNLMAATTCPQVAGDLPLLAYKTA